MTSLTRPVKKYTNKTRYHDIYNLVSEAGMQCSYVTECKNKGQQKITIKVTGEGHEQRLYGSNIPLLWTEVKDYIKDQQSRTVTV